MIIVFMDYYFYWVLILIVGLIGIFAFKDIFVGADYVAPITNFSGLFDYFWIRKAPKLFPWYTDIIIFIICLGINGFLFQKLKFSQTTVIQNTTLKYSISIPKKWSYQDYNSEFFGPNVIQVKSVYNTEYISPKGKNEDECDIIIGQNSEGLSAPDDYIQTDSINNDFKFQIYKDKDDVFNKKFISIDEKNNFLIYAYCSLADFRDIIKTITTLE